jgi:hypothetical protein
MDESLLNQENFCGPSGTWYGLNQSKKSDFRSKDPDFSNKMKGNGVSKTGQTGSDEMMKWGFNQPKLPQMVGVIPYRDPTWSLWCWYPAEVNPLILVALGLSEEYPSFHRLFGKVNLSFSETPKDHNSFRDHFFISWLTISPKILYDKSVADRYWKENKQKPETQCKKNLRSAAADFEVPTPSSCIACLLHGQVEIDRFFVASAPPVDSELHTLGGAPLSSLNWSATIMVGISKFITSI